MPDAERRVIYRAIADFSSLAAEAAKARAELEALKEAEGKYNKSSIEGVRGLEAAHKAKTAEIAKERVEEEKARQSLAQHTVASLADAKALEQRAEAERKSAEASKSHQGILSGTSPLSASETEKRVQAVAREAKATSEASKAQQDLTKNLKEARSALAEENTELSKLEGNLRRAKSLPLSEPTRAGRIKRAGIQLSVARAAATPEELEAQRRATEPQTKAQAQRDIGRLFGISGTGVSQGVEDTGKLAAANRGLAEAKTRVDSADLSRTRAIQNLETAQRKSLAAGLALEKMEDRLNNLRDGASETTVAKAEERVTRARELSNNAITRMAEAELAITRANLGQERAVEKLADAEARVAHAREEAAKPLAGVKAGDLPAPVSWVERLALIAERDVPKLAQDAAKKFDNAFQPSQTPISDWIEKTAKNINTKLGPAVRAGIELIVPSIFGRVNVGGGFANLAGQDRGVSEAGAKARIEGQAKETKAQLVLESARQKALADSVRAEQALARQNAISDKGSVAAVAATLRYDQALRAVEGSSRAVTQAEKGVSDAHEATSAAVKKAESSIRDEKSSWTILKREVVNIGTSFKEAEAGIRGASTAVRDTAKAAGESVSVFSMLGAVFGGVIKDGGEAGKAFEGVGTVLDSVGSAVSAAGGAFGSLISSIPGILPIGAILLGLAPAIGILGSLGAAVLGLVGAFSALAGGALVALPGIVGAAVTALGALFLAISPVVNALQALGAVSTATKQTALDPQAIAAQIQKTQALAAAYYNVAQAGQAINRAQTSLTATVLSATRSYQDLQETVANAALTERGASLDLQQAELAYRIAMADPNKTLLDREQAALAVQEAQVKLNDTNKTAVRNQQDLNLINKTGVMGTPAVVSAQDALASSLHGLVTAQQALTAAQISAVQPASAIQTALTASNLAMSKLSPAAKTVVDAIHSMSGAWTDLTLKVQQNFFTPILDQLPQIKSKLIPELESLLGPTATALGGVVAKGLGMLTSPIWQTDLKTIGGIFATMTDNMGKAALSVVDALKNITVAAGPFLTFISQNVADIANGFDQWSINTRKSGGLVDFLNVVKPLILDVEGIVGNIFTTFSNLGKAAAPFNQWLMDQLKAITGTWATASADAAKPGSSFQKTLENMKPVLTAFGGVLGALGSGFNSLISDPKVLKSSTDALNLLGGTILPDVFGWIKTIGDSPAFGKLIEDLKKAIDALSTFINSGAAQGVINVFDDVATVIGHLLDLIKNLHLAGFLGTLAGIGLSLGGLALALKLSGIFKIGRLLKKLPGLVSGAFGVLGKISNALFGKGGAAPVTGTADTASAGAELKTDVGIAGKGFIADVKEAGAFLKEGATTAATTQEEGAVTAGATTEGSAVTAGATTEGAAVAAGATLETEVGLAVVASAFIEIILVAVAGFLAGYGIGKLLQLLGILPTNTPIVPQAQAGASILSVGASTDPGVVARRKRAESAPGGIKIPTNAQDLPKPAYVEATTTGGAIQQIIGEIGHMARVNVLDPIGAFFTMIGHWFADVGKAIGGWFKSIWGNITGFFGDIGNWFGSAGKAVGSWFAGIWRNITGFFGDIGNWFDSAGKAVGGWFSSIWSNVTGFLGDIGNWFGARGKDIGSWFSSIWGNITGFFDDIGHWFTGLPKMVGNWLKSLGVPGLLNPFPTGNAKGGSLPEGVSMVGEVGPEWAVKSGRGVHIIPMNAFSASTARQSAINSGANTVPGYALGTNFGAMTRQTSNFMSATHVGSQLTSLGSKSEGGINIDHLDIHNPKPEPAGDSLYRSLQKIQYYAGKG